MSKKTEGVVGGVLAILIGISLFQVFTLIAEHIAPIPFSVEQEEDLPFPGVHSDNPLRLHRALIRFVDPKTKKGFCSASVLDDNYALTAAHCVTKEDFRGYPVLSKDLILIHNDQGKSTGILARAVAANKREDYALIKGDFRGFQFFRVANAALVNVQAIQEFPVMMCGFPHGGPGWFCNRLFNISSHGFEVIGYGSLFPGMSGGPVLMQIEGQLFLVGVNVAVHPYIGGRGLVNAVVVPYVNLLDTFAYGEK